MSARNTRTPDCSTKPKDIAHPTPLALIRSPQNSSWPASLKITYRDARLLKPRSRNPRTHSVRQIKQIAAGIKEFGFVVPVLIDNAGRIIAGHARVEAAKLLGMTDVPVICIDHLIPAQIQAFVIADNRLAELSGWDRELLALELQELS